VEIALVVVRPLLAVVFAVAAFAKLTDRAGSRQAIVDFGAPRALASPGALLLPLAELAVAVALIPRATAWWGALGALALLLLFSAAIAINLARGRKPDCRCFGQLSSSPVGRTTLARNGALAALAGFVVAAGPDDPGRSAVAWLGDLTAAELTGVVGALLALALLLIGAVLLINLARQNGRVLLRIEALERRLEGGLATAAEPASAPPAGLPVGEPAPGFQLSGLYGETLTLDALRAAGNPVLLVFADPNCVPCNALVPEISGWQRAYAPQLTIAFVTRGSPEENRAKATEHGLRNVLLQKDREVAEAYREEGTPSAVVVRPDGTIGSPLAAGPEAIRALVARTLQGPEATAAAPAPAAPSAGSGGSGNGSGPTPTPRAGPKMGEPAPVLRLPDLRGRTVNLTGYRGSKTLVLFWNPGCGFCQQMLDDLKAWEAGPPNGAPKLLVVSAGTVEENEGMGLRSPLLLDENFTVGSAFGASGTPMAVLVDEEGRIASDVVAGGPAVMALARGETPQSAQTPTAVGDPAPPLRLPDLGGNPVDLADFRGRKTLLLFWNPGCGFCQQMLEDLKAWEADRPEDAPETLVVSTGTVEANKALGLRSAVLLDENSAVAHAFSASGTPMAVLVDEQGRIASDVAAGATAVLALARGDEPSRLADVAG
jgi:peroxiredoxin